MAQTIHPSLKKTLTSHARIIDSLFSSPASRASPRTGVQLKDGDRVVFLGDTFIERMQVHNHLELRLTTAWPNRNITFRNLGWSGDTRGVSRAGLSLQQAGRDPLMKAGNSCRNKSRCETYRVSWVMAWPVRLKTSRNNLVKHARAQGCGSESAGGSVRFVVLSPLRHEQLGGGLPDPAVPTGSSLPIQGTSKDGGGGRGSLRILV